MKESMPPDLNSAIAAQPQWLQIWLMVLVIVNLGAVLFVITKRNGKWRPRLEPFIIIGSFVAAGVFMSWLYQQVGYVRLLGLPHLIFWSPAYVWILLKFRKGAYGVPFKYYILIYLVIDGISLLIDVSDVIRYLLN